MRLILVTGASQGIGQSIAEAFAADGNARICLVARNEANLEKVAARIHALGAYAEVYPCDVTDDDQVASMAQRVMKQHGIPDILVNNAGVFVANTILDTTPKRFRQMVEVNLTSAFLVTKAFLGSMIQRASGDIVYIGSVASIQAYSGTSAYGSAKHGLLGLARSVREETKSVGVRVTCILPGATMTPSWDGFDVDPKRIMAPADVAQMVVSVSKLDRGAVVEELILRPQRGDLVTGEEI